MAPNENTMPHDHLAPGLNRGTALFWLGILVVLSPWGTVSLARQPQRDDPPDKKTKEQELGERLIRDIVNDGDEGVMATAIRLMDSAARKLEIDFDAGRETQDMQRRALDQLDKAIKTAAARRRPVRSRRPPPSGDKRTRPRQPPQRAEEEKEASTHAKPPATHDPRGAEPQVGTVEGRLNETRRAWGQLPMRDREEIIQGADERFLERYRAWIERYYRALQEAED